VCWSEQDQVGLRCTGCSKPSSTLSCPRLDGWRAREVQVVSAACPDDDTGWSHCRRFSMSGELGERRRVIEGTRSLALRDHNPNRPLASSQLPELEGRQPAIPLDLERLLVTAAACAGPLRHGPRTDRAAKIYRRCPLYFSVALGALRGGVEACVRRVHCPRWAP
jgi:hypothetical protein